MNKQFSDNAWDDYLWSQKNDKRSLKRANQLVKSISRTPFEGIGKPEALHGNLTGYWSRRVNEVDRVVYKVDDETIYFAAMRGNYA